MPHTKTHTRGAYQKGYSLEELGLTKENFADFYKKWRNNELQFIDTEAIGKELQAEWERLSSDEANIHEKRLKKLLIGLGNTYSDLRTVDKEEFKNSWKDPIDFQNQMLTATALRGLEGVGWLSDKTLGWGGRKIGKHFLGLDEGNQQLMGIAAQFAAPSVVKRIPRIAKSPAVKQGVYNAGVKVGQQYKDGKQIVKTLKKVYDENLSKTPSKRVVNIKAESIIDDAMSYDTETITKARHIYKHHPDAGWTNALTQARRLKGVTNKGLIEGDLPLNKIMGRIQKIAKDRNVPDDLVMSTQRPISVNTLQQQLASGSAGMVQLAPRGRGESYPAYFDRIMQTYGARKENGYWIMDEDTFKKIPTSDARREIAQMLLTQLSQGVKGSFPKSKSVMNLKMNQDLARYNKKYAARADLHHGYPSVIGIEFYLGIPYMGKVWKQQMAIAAKYGNVPGQPMVDGKSNFISLPSSIPSTKTRRWGPVTKVKYPNPAYEEALAELEKKGLKVPQHIHQIIHDSFLTNEMGQRGQKFWKKWDPIIEKNPTDATWLAAYEDFNEIIARNRAIYNEAMSQLEAIFSSNPLSNKPEKIVDMLEEYIAKNKVTIGKGIVRDKNGKLVILKEGTDTALSKKKTVEYSQDAVKYELEEALIDFKKILREERIKQDPRFKDIVEEIEYFPKLTDAEKLRMEDLLYKIEYYHSVYIRSKDLKSAARRAWYVTGITKAEHKANLKEYYDLMQPKLFKLPKDAPRPKIDTLDKLQTSTFKDVKINRGEKYQLILDFKVYP